jgi:hypothetical protein
MDKNKVSERTRRVQEDESQVGRLSKKTQIKRAGKMPKKSLPPTLSKLSRILIFSAHEQRQGSRLARRNCKVFRQVRAHHNDGVNRNSKDSLGLGRRKNSVKVPDTSLLAKGVGGRVL